MTSKCHISFHFQTQATIKLPAMITVNRRSLLRNAADPSAGLVIASRVRAVADGHGVEQRRALDEVAPGDPGGRPPGQQRATYECALSRLPADDEDRPLEDDIAAAGQVIAVLADG